jgi:galactokinase
MSIVRKSVCASFAKAFGSPPALIVRAPGRVNLIGEHTDYNDGFVLPAAIGVETLVAASPRADGQIRVVAADFGDAMDMFALGSAIAVRDEPMWANYVRGMIKSMLDAGFALCGADIAVAGSIPKGTGLSSSASLEVAVGQAFKAMCGLDTLDPTRIAQLAQEAECGFVGMNCGIMDQLVSARGVAGHAILIDCRSLATEPVPVPDALAIMIVHSGISRGLVDGAYNERRTQCEAAARHFGVAALRDLDRRALDCGKTRLDDLTYRRARHVITENARTLAAADALRGGDLIRLGQLMAESHISMRDDFEITVPAIDALVAVLQAAIGTEGSARMTGGGFGGAVVAMLPADRVEAVTALVSAKYQTPEGTPPHIMIERPAAGAGLLV